MDPKDTPADEPEISPFVGSDAESAVAEELGNEGDYGNDVSDEADVAEGDVPAGSSDDTGAEDAADTEGEPDTSEEPEVKAESDTGTDDTDGGGEEKPATEAEEPKSDQRIPKQRFDEVNERRKAAEAKLAELEAERIAEDAAEQDSFDYDAKEQQYMEAVVDGEFDKAKGIRNEIRAAERTQIEALASKATTAATAATKDQLAFDAVVQELQAEYDVFNQDKKAYDQVMVDEVIDLRDGFAQSGLSQAAALRKAVDYVAKYHDLDGNSKAADTADVTEDPQKPAISNKPANRNVIDKKLKAAKQPPAMPQSEDQEREPGVPDMTEEEFEALPESKLREMRGDFV